MMVGSTGTISGTANLLPRLFVSHYNHILAFQKAPSSELLQEIQRQQDIISRADWALSRSGVVATKWVLERWYYPMGQPRKPLQPISGETEKTLERELKAVVEAERALEGTEAD